VYDFFARADEHDDRDLTSGRSARSRNTEIVLPVGEHSIEREHHFRLFEFEGSSSLRALLNEAW